MQIPLAPFPATYAPPPANCEIKRPSCKPENDCFIASYPSPGKDFLVNTYLTRPDRLAEVQGPGPIRSYMFNCQ